MNTSDLTKFKRTPLESALFKITECAVHTSSLQEYSAELHKIIQTLMYAKNFFVAVYEQNNSLINFIYVADEYDTGSDNHVLRKLSTEDLRRTLTGYMLRTGTMQHLSQSTRQKLTQKNIVDEVGVDCHDWLGVPLIYNDEILGGIVIQSYQDDIEYGDQEEDILQFVARQIALVFKSKQAEKDLIETNALLEKHVEERTEDLNRINLELANEVEERKKSQKIQLALYQITELVSTSDSLDDFYQSVHQVIKSLMYAENEYIALLTDDRQFIDFAYFVDEYNPSPKKRPFNQNEESLGFTEKVLQTGKSFLYCKEDEYIGVIGGKVCVSWLGVPLKDLNQVFGVLAIQSYQEGTTYNREQQQVLSTIGQQVATAILRKKDAESLRHAHEYLEERVRARTHELEETIEKRKLVERKLAHESLHDTLTGLPNRQYLLNSLNELMSNKQSQGEQLALLFLDLDRFKIINDSLGHHIGDLFLIEIAQRLKQCMRGGDLVARLGGDEFCILMPKIEDERVALSLSSRVLKVLKTPVEVANNSLITSASIGVRLAIPGKNSAEEVMSDADAAMYQAKHQGKNCYCLFDSKIKNIVTNRMKMERDLRDAIGGDQLFLVYQPLVNIESGEVEGFEALVRWLHPSVGLIGPDEFIPVAEETGLIVEIGEVVIDMACQTLAFFKRSELLNAYYLNVNASSVQVLARTLDQVIRKKLVEYQVDAKKLNIEITESILIEDYKAALNFVRELKAMQVKVYLDDFGTGYSSLSYLHKFPFDAIKLDRSFIQVLEQSDSNKTIVESIGQLAKNLGIHIVAEGIESQQQLEILKGMNYTCAQGYYFAKPMKLEKVLDYLSSVQEQKKREGN
ncbi:EAL domain-containing protein [Aliikangiella sp. IMCC44653]